MSAFHFLRSCFGGAVLVAAATAAAQDPGSPPAPMAQGGTVIGRDDLGREKEGDPGPDKMFEQAKVYMQKMQDTMRRGEKRRDDAKRQKDLIKLNCLNEKLGQANGHVHDGEGAMASLSDAVVRNDTGERRHEFARLRIFYQKVLVLGAEADNCAGEENGYVGPSQLEVDVDPTIPQGDPTDPGLPKPNFTTPPPGVEEAAQPETVILNPMLMM